MLGLALAALLVGAPAANAAQCTVKRSQVEADIAAGFTEEELAVKYAGCTADDTQGTSATAVAAGEGRLRHVASEMNVITNTGSIFYERITQCGYHPQREEAVCAVEIRQNFGFGGRICQGPGSHEWVLLCVILGGAWVPVGVGGVHVHDANAGSVPPWDFGVVTQAQPQLAGQLNNGQTLQARTILSWFFVPTGCNYIPIWGNQADFRIRLDP
jgi:hypothetical protein